MKPLQADSHSMKNKQTGNQGIITEHLWTLYLYTNVKDSNLHYLLYRVVQKKIAQIWTVCPRIAMFTSKCAAQKLLLT